MVKFKENKLGLPVRSHVRTKVMKEGEIPKEKAYSRVRDKKKKAK